MSLASGPGRDWINTCIRYINKMSTFANLQNNNNNKINFNYLPYSSYFQVMYLKHFIVLILRFYIMI